VPVGRLLARQCAGGGGHGGESYLNVTPLEERMRTLCLFFLTPSFGASSFWPVALDKDLYTAAISANLTVVCCACVLQKAGVVLPMSMSEAQKKLGTPHSALHLKRCNMQGYHS